MLGVPGTPRARTTLRDAGRVREGRLAAQKVLLAVREIRRSSGELLPRERGSLGEKKNFELELRFMLYCYLTCCRRRRPQRLQRADV
eukprot:3606286-Heterocapsa_arctica.AAC.1